MFALCAALASAQPPAAQPAQPAGPVEFAGRPLKFWLDELASDSLLRKEEALAVLAAIGPPAKEAMPEVEKFLTAKQAPLRKKAALAVWKLGGSSKHVALEYAAELKSDDRIKQYETLMALQQMKGDAAPAIPAMLAATPELTKTGNISLLQSVIRTLGKDAFPSLIDALGSPSAEIRSMAVSLLSQSGADGTKAAIPALEERCKNDDPVVRVRAAWALWLLGQKGDEQLTVFANDLGKGDPELRAPVLNVLVQLSPRRKDLLPAFKLGLTDKDIAVQARCADAVWDLTKDANTVVPILLGVLKTTNDPYSRWKIAVPVLAKIGPPAKAANATLFDRFKGADGAYNPHLGAALLATGGPDLVEPLFALLATPRDLSSHTPNPNPNLHARAEMALFLLGEPALKLAIAKLDDKNAEARRAACELLARFGPDAAKGVAPRLGELLLDDNFGVQIHANTALQKLGPEAKRAEKQIIAAADGKQPVMRQHAYDLLAQFDADKKVVTEIATKALAEKSASAYANGQGVVLLARVDPENPEIEKTVRKMFTANQNELYVPIHVIGKLGPKAKAFVPDLVKLLPNRSYHTHQVCRILGNLGADAKDAIPALIETLTKNQANDAQLAAAEALLKLDVRDKKTAAALAKAALHIPPGSGFDYYGKPRPEHEPALELLARMKGDAAEAVPFLQAAHNYHFPTEFITKITETLLAIDPEGTKKDYLPKLKTHLQSRFGQGSRAFQMIPSILKISPDDKDVLDYLKRTATDDRAFASPQDRADAIVALIEMGTDPKSFANLEKTLFASDAALVQGPTLAYAMWRVTGDTPRALSVLMTATLGDGTANSHVMQMVAVRMLGKMGAEAKSAVPTVAFMTCTTSYYFRPTALAALAQIDPALAARLPR